MCSSWLELSLVPLGYEVLQCTPCQCSHIVSLFLKPKVLAAPQQDDPPDGL